MNWLDIAILAVIALSMIISLIRGFVREVISLVAWIAAFWAGIRFSEDLAGLLAGYVASPTLQLGIAFALLFVGVLLVGGLVNFAAGKLVGRTGLAGTDRFLGVFFGAARGVLVVAVLILAAGLTALPRETWWQESILAGQVQPWVCEVGVQERLEGLTVYAPLAGDEALDGTPAPEYWEEFCGEPGGDEGADADDD